MFIKNQIDLDTKKWEEEKAKRSEAGKKGMKNRWHNKNNSVITKDNKDNNVINAITNITDNENDNENVNVNVNGNDTTITSSIYDYLENIFGRSLYEPEYEIVETWEDNDLTKYAINQAVLNGAFNIKYIDKILFSYKKNNITTVQQAQMEEENFRKSKTKKYGRQQTADDLDEMFKDWGDEDEEE